MSTAPAQVPIAIDVTEIEFMPDGEDVISAAYAYSRAGLAPCPVYGLDTSRAHNKPERYLHACRCPDTRHDGQLGGPACGSPGKHPIGNAWQRRAHDAAGDADAVERLFASHPSCNIGLAMGGRARCVALDIDGPDGRASLAALEAEHGALPATLTSRSGRADGGEHRLFRVPEHLDLSKVKNRAGKLGKGLDVRGEGGQIVVAPSPHAAGGAYRWERVTEPAELPEWLYRLAAAERSGPSVKSFTPAGPKYESGGAVDRPESNDSEQLSRIKGSPSIGQNQPSEARIDRYTRGALDAACDALRSSPRGSRNTDAAREAFAIGGLVGAGHLSQDDAFNALLAATHAGGWDESAEATTVATLRRQLREGAREPRAVPESTKAQRKTERKMVNAVEGAEAKGPGLAKTRPAPEVGLDEVELIDGTAAYSDLANGERFVGLFGASARFVAKLGGWHTYDGKRWAEGAAAAQVWAQETARQIMLAAEERLDKARKVEATIAEAGDEDATKRAAAKRKAAEGAVAHATRSQSAHGLSSMLRVAEAMLPATHESFDADPWALNCANGTIDLRTGALRPHRREDMMTKIAPVAFDPEAPCPRWVAFLEEVQPDPEVRAFLQRLVGYSLTGSIRDHVLPINWGGGRNGKGVFMNAILRVLGDYGVAVPTELVMVKRGDAHPTERTVLYGRRFASAQETEEGRALNVGLVKMLTGGDPIRARRMREDFWEFMPTHKLWISTNNKPGISETGNAIWERVKLIPWTVMIPAERRDPQLGEKLFEEAPGILAWAVRGCLDYLAGGLRPPPAVEVATAGYREQQDGLGDFLGERCVVDAAAKVARSDLRKAYERWAEAIGARETLGPRNFAEKLRERGMSDVKCVRNSAGDPERGWLGLRLKTEVERRAELAAAEEADRQRQEDPAEQALRAEQERLEAEAEHGWREE